MPAKRDLTGMVFGELTVLYELPERKNGKIQWHCKCSCGKEINIIGTQLTKTANPTRSCGCLQRKRTREANRSKDLTGQKFGRLTVLRREQGSSKWVCQCECGNITVVPTNKLNSGHTKSCGCLQRDKISEAKFINLVGQKFGLLTVKSLNIEKSSNERKYWNCQCECGNISIVSTRNLRNGDTQSCGCSRMSHGEIKIKQILESYNIPFEQEKIFESCRNPKTNKPLRFDFYVNNQYLIEFDGKQHFTQSKDWEPLEEIQHRDNIKNMWCKEHNILLIRIPYTKLNNLTINDILPQ